MLNQSHIRGVLASYDFSEGTGTTLTDKSGNGNNAAIVGGTWTTDRFGRANRAILLDGVDDYIDCGLANYQGDISWVISFNPVTIVDGAYIISKGWHSNNTLYPPAFRQILRTSNAINTNVMWGGANGPLPTVAYQYAQGWNITGGGIKSGAGAHSIGGRQATNLNANYGTAWNNYPIRVGAGLNVYVGSKIIDRIMLFNRFLSGHELSKLANRLKIGDMDK